MMGGFNLVKVPSKRFGSVFDRHEAALFKNFIDEAELSDIIFDGPSFTRAKKWGSKLIKLDRFLVSEGLSNLYPSMVVKTLLKGISDHSSILLFEQNHDYVLPSFRLFHSWFGLDGFDNLVKEA